MATLAPSMAPSLLPSVSPIPSVLPSTFFTETPTTVTDYIASTTWQDILTVFYYQLIFAGFLWIVYEVARPRAKNIYYPRRRWQKLKVPPQPQPPRQFFAWIPPVFTMPGTETLNRVGLDAYMLLRFIRLCSRLTAFTAFIGCVVLIPVYENGNGGFTYFNKLTINNITYNSTHWLPTTMMVLFTAHAFYLLNHEYKCFFKWRIAFLSRSSIEHARYQSRYSIRLDNVPQHLRSNFALEKFIASIFPGAVFCANVQVELKELEALHKRRLRVVDALERAIAYQHATGRTKMVVLYGRDWSHWTWTSWCTCKGEAVEAPPYFRDLLQRLNRDAQVDQDQVHQQQRTATNIFRQESLRGTPLLCNPRIHENPTEDSNSLVSPDGVNYLSSSDSDAEPPVTDPERQSSDVSNRGICVSAVSSIKLAAYGAGRMVNKMTNNALNQLKGILQIIRKLLSAFASLSSWCYNEIMRKVIQTSSSRQHGVTATVSRTAFVTLTSELAVTTLCSGCLSEKANTLLASLAPEPEDLIWKNVTIPIQSRRLRNAVAVFCYLIIGIFWSAIVSLISTIGVASGEQLKEWGVDPNTEAYTLFVRLLPITLQLGLLALIPVVVQLTGEHLEGIQTQTALQEVIFSRYFLFQLVNILVTLGSISYFTFLDEYTLADIPTLLVDTFPRTGAYFIEFILIKTMFGCAWELSRPWPGIQMVFALCCSDSRQWTKRSLRQAYLSCPETLYGWIYPSVLSVMVIAFTYQVVTPIVSLFAFVFFVIAELVHKNNLLFVYSSKSQSGGLLWNSVFKRMIAGLIFAHFLLSCYLLVKEAYWQQAVMYALIVADLIFAVYAQRTYEWPSMVVPLNIAANKDRRDGTPSHRPCRFSNQAYEPLAMRMDSVEEEPFDSSRCTPFTMANDESIPLPEESSPRSRVHSRSSLPAEETAGPQAP